MIDIDHFKRYNDTFGHPQGDVALQTVAHVIKQSSEGDIVLRYGGEEFAIIVLSVDEQKKDVYAHAEEVRKNIRNTIIQPSSADILADSFLEDKWIWPSSPREIKTALMNYVRATDDITPSNHQTKLRDHFGMFNLVTYRALYRYITLLQRITVSIGGASSSPHDTLKELIHKADRALYKAKRKRDMVVIAP